MEIKTKTVASVTVVEIAGDIDSNTAPSAQQQIMALVKPGCKILLDMSQVGFMSSAGLRLLLFLYRQITGNGGQVVVVGLSEAIQETMSLTGFLGFFKLYDTQEAGLAVLQ
jgi:anti-sigma B factor antagonist